MLFAKKKLQEAPNCSLTTIWSLNKNLLTPTHTQKFSHTNKAVPCCFCSALMFSCLPPPQQCVSYPCVFYSHSSLLPWMLTEASDCLLGFGLAWPCRPMSKCMLCLSYWSLICLFPPFYLSLFSLFFSDSLCYLNLCPFLTAWASTACSSHTFISLYPKSSEALQNILKQFCFRVVAWN